MNSASQLIQILEPYNPWWQDPDWYSKDDLIREYEESDIKLLPRLYYHIAKNIVVKNKYGIVTLRGPRRSGKTTIIKLLVKHLIEKHNVDPRSIFYITLDYEGLRNIQLSNVLMMIAQLHDDEKYVFIDEASLYHDWVLALKNIYDTGMLSKGKMKILVTGSHSMDITDVASKLRGRQGELADLFNLSGNLIHVPLRFSEFIEARIRKLDEYISKEFLRKPKVRFNILASLANGNIDDHINKIREEYFHLVANAFENYLKHGGYPKAIKNYYKKGLIEKSLYTSIAELLIKDAERVGIEEGVLKRVLGELVNPRRLSGLTDFNKDQELIKLAGDKRVLHRCIEYLRTTWAFFFAYREEGISGSCKPNYQEPRKNYVLDPLIYYAVYSYLNNVPDPYMESVNLLNDGSFKGRMVESVVAAHLLLAQQLFEHVGSVEYDKVLLYRREGAEGGEVDFILCINNGGQHYRFVIESKYRSSSSGTTKETGKIVLTKDKLNIADGVVYIPVSIFLLLF